MEEFAKLCGLHGNVGYTSDCVAWVKFLRVAWVTKVKIFFTWVIVSSAGYVGRNTFYVGRYCAWVAWVECIFASIKIFCMGPKLLQRSILFCMDQLSFTRQDYFTILQLTVETDILV